MARSILELIGYLYTPNPDTFHVNLHRTEE
jgi:hypothetical protein